MNGSVCVHVHVPSRIFTCKHAARGRTPVRGGKARVDVQACMASVRMRVHRIDRIDTAWFLRISCFNLRRHLAANTLSLQSL